jgi:hypothetical protein
MLEIEKVSDFMPTIVEDHRTPIRMLSLSRIFVLEQG